MHSRVFLGFVLMFMYSPTFAQYVFDSWTTDHGLPQNGVRGIGQTPDGYLWLTTFDGLVRFDGVRFTTFDKANTKGIATNRFSSLAVDEEGTIWLGTEERGITVSRSGTFTSYSAAQLPGLFDNEFSPDSSGEMRIRFHTKEAPSGAWYYLRNEEFVFSENSPRPHGQIIYRGREGTEWTIRQDGVTERKRGVVRFYQYQRSAFGFSLFEDISGRLWIGGYGLHLLQDGILTQLSGTNGLPAVMNYHSFWEESDSSVWFATGDHSPGIGIVQYKNGKFHMWGADVGLTNNHIYDVFRDREGNVWLATNKGLNCLRRKTVTSLAGKDGLTNEEVYPIYQEANGDIWIGGGKLWRYRNGRFETIISKGVQGNPFTVQSLFKDHSGVLWIGVVGALYRYENQSLTDVPELNILTCNAILQDRNGDVWVGTTEGGVVQFRGRDIQARYSTANGLPSNDVKAILEDPNGVLWFGTYGGLVRFADGKFTAFTTDDGLASNRVRSLYRDAEGILWIGTYDGGLSRLKDGKIFSYTTRHGLFNNGVFATLEDRGGEFWISCNRGIYRVKKSELNDVADGKLKSLHSAAYGKKDGLVNTECNGGRQPSAIVDRSGLLWFPTQQGVAVVDPEAAKPDTMPPPVVIEKVLVNHEAMSSTESLELPWDQTNIEVMYTGLSFVKPDQVKFRYKMEGHDADWLEAGNRRVAYYSSLPPGEYVFRVIAGGSEGVWNTMGASLSITVKPAFYQTAWFQAGAVVVVLSFGVMFFLRRTRQLQRESARQQEFTRQLIDSQESERKRIAAELHDSLSQSLVIIKNRAALTKQHMDDKENAVEQLDEIVEASSSALDEVREIVHNLRPIQLDRLGLTRAIEDIADRVLVPNGIRVMKNLQEIDGLFPPDVESSIYRIVQESVNNILKHAQARAVSISTLRHNDAIELLIIDDGKGFDLESVAMQKAGENFGLKNIAERGRLLGGTLTIDSGSGIGTTVRFVLQRVDRA